MNRMTYITMICLAFVGVAAAGGWTYEDPENWVKTSTSCGKDSQSPIDIIPDDAMFRVLTPFNFSSYKIVGNRNLTNNGHSVKLSFNGPLIRGGKLGGTYKAVQLHFHWAAEKKSKGSEHAIDGFKYPLEMHIVHFNKKYKDVADALNYHDGLAVLGVFFKMGNVKNNYLESITPYVDTVKGDGQAVNFDLVGLVSEIKSDRFYRYDGSLTTPPCSEVVTWTIFADPLSISKDQLMKFWKVTDSHSNKLENDRPLQDLNKRIVYASFNPSSSGMTKAFSVLIVFSVFVSYLS